MSRAISHESAARSVLCALALAALSACANGTAPDDPAELSIHHVLIKIDRVTVTGSCDHNSIFESAADGEFTLSAVISSADGSKREFERSFSNTLREETYEISTWRVVLRRDITKQTGLRVQVWATEKDGLLGADPAMSNRNAYLTHQWDGTKWSNLRFIELVGSREKCGLRIDYSITSTPVE